MYTLWHHCRIATMVAGHYQLLDDGAMLTDGAVLLWVGNRAELPDLPVAQRVDLQGRVVTPGLVDCHSHAVFGGDRAREFEMRLNGASYAEIAAGGGGIASTVNATRQASESQLLESARQRIRELCRDGVTALEIKSGYGLDLANERKMLRAIRRLGDILPLTVRSTCLAAHAVPVEYQERADAWIDYICERLLPELHQEGLVDAVDAFCEHLAFSPSQVERVFQKARELGLPVKLHAEQLTLQHGAALVPLATMRCRRIIWNICAKKISPQWHAMGRWRCCCRAPITSCVRNSYRRWICCVSTGCRLPSPAI